jgi:hypothetical protein
MADGFYTGAGDNISFRMDAIRQIAEDHGRNRWAQGLIGGFLLGAGFVLISQMIIGSY